MTIRPDGASVRCGSCNARTGWDYGSPKRNRVAAEEWLAEHECVGAQKEMVDLRAEIDRVREQNVELLRERNTARGQARAARYESTDLRKQLKEKERPLFRWAKKQRRRPKPTIPLGLDPESFEAKAYEKWGHVAARPIIHAGFTSFEEVAQASDSQLLSLYYFGPKSLDIVRSNP